MDLEQLIEKTRTGGCTIDREFLAGDSDLAVRAELDDDWDTAFLAE